MRLQLKQKHFVPFIVVCCLLAALGIAAFTYYYRISKEHSFKERVTKYKDLKYEKMSLEFSEDSVSIHDFNEEYIVLNFWASWSNFAKKVHNQLHNWQQRNPGSVRVIAASVRNGDVQVQEYKKSHKYPFVYVEGSELYNELEVPGVPSTIIFNSYHEVVDIVIGYKDSLGVENYPESLVSNNDDLVLHY